MSDVVPQQPSSYPVTFDVERQLTDRNRLTTAFRIFLAIPHIILVGGAGFGIGGGWSSNGVLGTVAGVMAIIAWFAILITGKYPQGLYEFAVGVLRWDMRVEAYLLLMRDEYPPFSLQP